MLMAATVGGVYLCYRLALPFLAAFTWALALAVVFVPFQRWAESKVKRPSVAAAISVLVIGLVVLGLAAFVGQRLIQEAGNSADLIKNKVASGEWRQVIAAHPRLVPFADWVERQFDLPGTTKDFANWLTTTAGAFVKGSMVQAVGFCLTFYLLFFFLRDRRAALQALRSLSPLTDLEMDRLFGRAGDTIYATIYGTLAVSAVQGLLGGLMFWWLGLPAPLLWGVMMALLAVVPVLGAFVIWVPAALYLALEGSWGKALILAAWGGLIIGSIDNLLYPLLVGNRLKLHTVLAFVSIVGGLMLFGPAGLILGPLALTVTAELLETWRSRIAMETVARNEPEALSRFENEGGHCVPEPAVTGSGPPGTAKPESVPRGKPSMAAP
jgi:predicted PurR-regulated permease PerM